MANPVYVVRGHCSCKRTQMRHPLNPPVKHWLYEDGIVIHGSFPDPEVMSLVQGQFPLTMFDPPYGGIVSNEWDKIKPSELATLLISWSSEIAKRTLPNAALYLWGGIGTHHNRPYFSFLSRVEEETPWALANLITWSKKRAYGVQNNYLFTREECAYLVNGDPKKPHHFDPPYLDTKRGYTGYNEKYPAKSEFFRRTSVWSDITEMFSGKEHPTQKPVSLYEVPILAHTLPGEIVFDPMAGSGTTAIAARKNNRRFCVIEREASYIEVIRKRLSETQPGLTK